MPDPNPDAVDVWIVLDGYGLHYVATRPGEKPSVFREKDKTLRLNANSFTYCFGIDKRDEHGGFLSLALMDCKHLNTYGPGHGVRSDNLREPVDLREK